MALVFCLHSLTNVSETLAPEFTLQLNAPLPFRNPSLLLSIWTSGNKSKELKKSNQIYKYIYQ